MCDRGAARRKGLADWGLLLEAHNGAEITGSTTWSKPRN